MITSLNFLEITKNLFNQNIYKLVWTYILIKKKYMTDH